MEKVMAIEGMSCQHCVKAVEKALSALSGVSAVTVELAKKQAAITLNDAAVSNEALKAAVEEAGYEVLDIQ